MGSVVCDLGEVMEGSSGRVLLCGGSVGGGLRCLLEVG